MDAHGIVRAVCTSPAKGTEKRPVDTGVFLKGHGIENDAHAGNWHRQVSLLTYEKVEEFNRKGAGVTDGDFGENVLVEGIDLGRLPVGTILKAGTVTLKVTQIGKECHSQCAIRRRVGDCIMPREGIFAEVVEGGVMKKGDVMTVILPAWDRPFTAAVITLSDKGAGGKREDKSGPAACEILRGAGYDIIETLLIPDEPELLKRELCRLADMRQADLIITSGGTGFSLRDRTPEATMTVADRIAPGISEYIRMRSSEITSRAILSRGVSVIRKRTLIINLPGSPKAVKESLGFILEPLDHGLRILRGSASECGATIV
ncbi:MAG: molybdopterin-binding protein [Lachnospiraceae bacterium]|nr:molybdopterin-binding protein [Lachnospiraceae bacterium]